MNVLITGSTGFVGSNLVDYLYSKQIVVNTLDRVQNTNHKVEKSFTWDNFMADSLNGINAIIHLAGKAHDVKKTSEPEAYFNINTGLTKTIFDMFLRSNVQSFVYFSSVKAVADIVESILTEDAMYSAKTPYGQSKQHAEKYILQQQLSAGKRVFIMRPCMIHGPGNKGNLNLLYKFVVKGIPYPLAAFYNYRSFLSIDNLTFAIEKIISNQDIASGTYNIADDEALSTNQVIEIIATTSNLKPRLWSISPAMIKTAAKVGDILHLPLNSDRLKKLTESYVVSNSKIKRALNIDSFPVSSTDGLKKTIKSFSDN